MENTVLGNFCPLFSLCFILVVSLLFGKLAAGRLGRRGCCAVAFITQVIALGAIVFYRFHAKAGFLDYVVLLTAITLLAAGDSIWESQVWTERGGVM